MALLGVEDPLPSRRTPAREKYESALHAMRIAPTVTAFGIAKRARLLAPGWHFDPNGHCVVCGQHFGFCEHSEQENEWAIAVVRFNLARL